MNIDIKNLPLNEIIKQYPGSRFVFEQFRLDYCCGGKQILEQVCTKRGINIEEVINGITKRAEQKEDVIQFAEWPLDLLTEYIEKKHHRYVEDNLSHINEKLDRLVHRHGDENPQLKSIQGLFFTIAGHLAVHMKKEELVLFPYIRNMVKAQREQRELKPAEFGTVGSPIAMMEKEHEEEGGRMHEIAELTDNFTPPAHACATWQYTYEKLAEFEKDLHLHIHLENNILFPGALALEKQFQQQPESCSLNRANMQ